MSESKPETVASEPSPGDGRLMGHEYDGIQEYDNPTPGWWRAIFVGCIIWAIGYGLWYSSVGPGVSPNEAYAAAKKEHDALVARTTPTVTEELLAKKAADPVTVDKGKATFNTYCVACHLAGGLGKDGPNLTDGFQLHGTLRMDIYHTIHNGVPGKPMVAWGPILPPGTLIDVASYVISLRNTNAPGGKAPQGERVQPFSK